MTDTFQKTLHSILIGARTLEEFSTVVVSAAVEDTLLCVARDYGHDYVKLLKTYKKAVVARHASGAITDKTQCRGVTKGNKRCNKRAQIQGYCSTHAAEWAAEDAKRRKAEAYQSNARASKPTAEALALETFFGPVSAQDYCVPPPPTPAAALTML